MDNEQCAAAFDEELAEYFRDNSDCEDCLNPTTAHVCPWPQQLPQCMTTFPNLMEIAGRALATDTAEYYASLKSGETCYADYGCFACNGVDGDCYETASFGELAIWNTSAITSFNDAFSSMTAFNQVRSALHACA